MGYKKIQINGEWFTWDEREEKLKTKFLEEGEKRRRTDEKRYKEKVNKKVDEQSKRNGKKNKGKSLPKEYK
jgi:hypothetical protein